MHYDDHITIVFISPFRFEINRDAKFQIYGLVKTILFMDAVFDIAYYSNLLPQTIA